MGLGSPEGGALAFAVALYTFSEDPRLGTALLTLTLDISRIVDGPEGVSGKQPFDLRDFRERNGARPYIARPMFQGTSPAQGYAMPPLPWELRVHGQPQHSAPDDVRLYIVTTGADSPKPLRLKRNDKGLWKALEWSSFQGNCRPPVQARVDDL